MKWSKILVLTFKPAVENSWKRIYFLISILKLAVCSKDNSYNEINRSKPFAYFAHLRFLGKNSLGIKIKNSENKIKWDCIISMISLWSMEDTAKII